MRVQLNGEWIELPEGCTLKDLLERLSIDPTQIGVAVAINQQVIPRAAWGSHPLAEGDKVEIVYARQGG